MQINIVHPHPAPAPPCSRPDLLPPGPELSKPTLGRPYSIVSLWQGRAGQAAWSHLRRLDPIKSGVSTQRPKQKAKDTIVVPSICCRVCRFLLAFLVCHLAFLLYSRLSSCVRHSRLSPWWDFSPAAEKGGGSRGSYHSMRRAQSFVSVRQRQQLLPFNSSASLTGNVKDL